MITGQTWETLATCWKEKPQVLQLENGSQNSVYLMELSWGTNVRDVPFHYSANSWRTRTFLFLFPVPRIGSHVVNILKMDLKMHMTCSAQSKQASLLRGLLSPNQVHYQICSAMLIIHMIVLYTIIWGVRKVMMDFSVFLLSNNASWVFEQPNMCLALNFNLGFPTGNIIAANW